MFGDHLRQARIDAGMSQERLALDAEMDRTYLSELENNHKSPTLDMLFRLCEALGISASGLIARVEKERRQR